jgi:hypothetical protein
MESLEKSVSTSAEQPRSRLAILSFVFGLVLWFLWCALYGTLGILAETNNMTETTGLAGFIFGPVILGVITLGLGIAGAVLGIQAIRKQDPKRGFAIAGLVLNFICLCPFILLLVFVLISGVSSIPSLIQQALP